MEIALVFIAFVAILSLVGTFLSIKRAIRALQNKEDIRGSCKKLIFFYTILLISFSTAGVIAQAATTTLLFAFVSTLLSVAFMGAVGYWAIWLIWKRGQKEP